MLLIWLLDCFRSQLEVMFRLKLPLIDFDLIAMDIEYPSGWSGQMIDVTEAELETASLAWRAYWAPTRLKLDST